MVQQGLVHSIGAHDMWDPPYLSTSLTITAIFSTDKANVISLLLSGHSIRKVESITGLGSTVGGIYQKLEMDKENYKGGRLSKLSPTEKFAE